MNENIIDNLKYREILIENIKIYLINHVMIFLI